MVITLLVCLQVEELVRRWYAEPDARPSLTASIAKFPIADVERAVRGARTYEKRETGVVRLAAPNSHDPKVEVTYRLLVPDYDPAKRYPLLVTLHGRSGSAESQMALWSADARKEEGLFVLAPDAGKGGWGRSRLGFGNVLGPLRQALELYPIDPDRVFLDGVSMGGNGSFQFATYFPDLFAGVAPRAGGPEFIQKDEKTLVPRLVENLVALPVYWIVGVRDRDIPIEWVRTAKDRMEKLKVDLTYREMDGGHEWFPEENPKVLAWMRDRKRAVAPKRIHWVTHERLFARAYWVEITAFAASAEERWNKTYVTPENEKIEERLHFLHGAEVKGTVEGNTIRLTTTHVKKLRLHLSDALLDLDAEIEIVVNGARMKKKVQRSASRVLESGLRDRSALVSAVIDVDVK
jgi:pimeloyl-ACP methyl ester carboxylesterase